MADVKRNLPLTNQENEPKSYFELVEVQVFTCLAELHQAFPKDKFYNFEQYRECTNDGCDSIYTCKCPNMLGVPVAHSLLFRKNDLQVRMIFDHNNSKEYIHPTQGEVFVNNILAARLDKNKWLHIKYDRELAVITKFRACFKEFDHLQDRTRYDCDYYLFSGCSDGLHPSCKHLDCAYASHMFENKVKEWYDLDVLLTKRAI